MQYFSLVKINSRTIKKEQGQIINIDMLEYAEKNSFKGSKTIQKINKTGIYEISLKLLIIRIKLNGPLLFSKNKQ